MSHTPEAKTPQKCADIKGPIIMQQVEVLQQVDTLLDALHGGDVAHLRVIEIQFEVLQADTFLDALQGGDVAHLRVSKVQNEVLLIDTLLHALQR
jgi:hypothetical protein